ncbi:MAG: hypothetical protein AB7P18_22170 [Candidatus Binatia bacterium]
MTDTRPMPLLGDISLRFVQRMEHTLAGGFVATPIASLAGELQQRASRPSHRIWLSGILFGDDAADQLATLQTAAQTGEELTFAADITTALDLQKVVITAFRAVEVAGTPKQFQYDLHLAESPPLPPPAQISGFGGLDDFGLGDLGIDTSVLDDIQDLAGEVAGAVDAALDVVEQLEALASLADLGSLGGFLEPLQQSVSSVETVAANFSAATRDLARVFQQ